MDRTTKYVMTGLAVVALLGVGLASAQGPGYGTSPANAEDAPASEDRPRGPIWERVCEDEDTVAECREKVQAFREERQQAAYERCLEQNDQDTCDERLERHEQCVEEHGPHECRHKVRQHRRMHQAHAQWHRENGGHGGDEAPRPHAGYEGEGDPDETEA